MPSGCKKLSSVARQRDERTYLLDEFNASLKIKPEIDELPVDTFALVLFLFEDEHVVVEELLEFLVHEVYPDLLEAIVLQKGFFQSPAVTCI